MADAANTTEAADAFQTRLKSAKRNDPCPCGSGKKYKKCHLPEDEAQQIAKSAEAQREAELKQKAELAAAEAEAEAAEAASPGTKKPLASKAAPKLKRDAPSGAKGQRGGPRPNNLPRRKAV